MSNDKTAATFGPDVSGYPAESAARVARDRAAALALNALALGLVIGPTVVLAWSIVSGAWVMFR